MASGIKVIHRKGPIQVEDNLVLGTPRPGTIMVRSTAANDIGKFTAAGASDDNGDLFILDKFQMQGKTIDEAYEAGDPCRAYRCITGAVMQVRAEAANYTYNQALTVKAGGVIGVAASGNEIIGYVETARNITSTDVTANENLLEVTFTNRPAAG